MSTQAIPWISPEQYLEAERAAEFRSEYIEGQVVAMSGATRNHNRIATNALARIVEQLRGRSCEAAGSDSRISIPGRNVFTYPDIVVTCGPDKLLDDRRDTLIDATLIVEVLSPSTRRYDLGEKFFYYRSLPSFSEYLVLEQNEIRAEHHSRQPDNSWVLREYRSLSDQIELRSIGCHLRLEWLYERVEFGND